MIIVFILIMQIFILFWLIRAFKSALFWIYLWQLKEYHIGRFLDHFRTHNGKKALFNIFSASKYILFFLLLFSNNYLFYYAFLFLFVIYAAEFVIFIKNILLRDLKIPKFTVKAIFLTTASFALIISYLFSAAAYLEIAQWKNFFISVLAFDILSPVVFSGIIFIFQPFFVLARNSILQKAKEKISKNKNLTVIGITGSYGKTSTKEFLKTILASKFSILATPEHQNSEIGIAKTILSEDFDKLFSGEAIAPISFEEIGARPGTQKDLRSPVFVVEMGSYKKGGIKLLCDIVKPKIGIVTGVNEQHMALFGSMENLLSAEGGKEL